MNHTRPDGLCLRGHPVGVTGRTCPDCETERHQWLAVFTLLVRLIRLRGGDVEHRPRTTRLVVLGPCAVRGAA